MNINEFSKVMDKLQTTYNTPLAKEQLIIWFEQFKGLSIEDFKRAVDKTISTNKYMPTIAEIRANINKRRMNLDSSYWYANFKDIRPCFNVKTGELLEPYN